MTPTNTHRALTDNEKQTLIESGCRADNWADIQVAKSFDPTRLQNVRLVGPTQLGDFNGEIDMDGVKKPAGIYNAMLIGCTVADGARIANVGVHLAHYDIGAGACIENIGEMAVRPGAAFGAGVQVEALNEAGGREVTLFNDLSAQFAYLMCVHQHRPKLVKKLRTFADQCVNRAQSDRGCIGQGAIIKSVGRIIDVNIGDHATIDGAVSLQNGAILSSAEAPTTVGAGVLANDFIIAESASVTGAAMVSKTYVGQGTKVGRQYSAENALFFANCEAFHGEAVAVFAGPYTVTHHKSTLLIAGLFSFYNAGSGTNQSNHMYKLGPVHEGKLERGCKTGSFSYMMWPCRVGPFSVVLGKHKSQFDAAAFPFSILDADAAGKCNMVPGLNLITVGTVRDGAKWPTRDRRKGKALRDRISFDVFNPMTVGRMIAGSAILKQYQDNTDRAIDTVNIRGAQVKRVLLRTGQKFYRTGVEMYLLEKVVARAEQAATAGKSFTDAFAADTNAVYSEQWLDIAGQLMPKQRLDDLAESVEAGRIADADQFHAELDRIADAYAQDEWLWVRRVYQQVFGRTLDESSEDDVITAAESLATVRGKFLKQILADAKKEFDDKTRLGFGQDGGEDDVTTDFTEVRGTFESNKFNKQMQDEIASLEQRVVNLRRQLARV